MNVLKENVDKAWKQDQEETQFEQVLQDVSELPRYV